MLATEGKLLPITFFSEGGEKGGGLKSVLRTEIIAIYCNPVTTVQGKLLKSAKQAKKVFLQCK